MSYCIVNTFINPPLRSISETFLVMLNPFWGPITINLVPSFQSNHYSNHFLYFFFYSFAILMCILKYYSLALSIKKIHVFEGSFNKFSFHPFLFLTVCLWKNPGYLTYRVSNSLICADYIFLFLFNMFFSSLYCLKIDNWIQRLDQTQVWSLL